MDAVSGASSLFFSPVKPIDPSLTGKGEQTPGLLRDFHDAGHPAVITIIGYGDETWVFGQPWNNGTCTIGLGVSSTVFTPREDGEIDQVELILPF